MFKISFFVLLEINISIKAKISEIIKNNFHNSVPYLASFIILFISESELISVNSVLNLDLNNSVSESFLILIKFDSFGLLFTAAKLKSLLLL